MEPEVMKACFVLGLKVAEHVHGIRRSGNDSSNAAIFDTVKAVAEGSLTLMDTPEEIIASLPTPPAPIKANIGPVFYELLRIARQHEKLTAEILLEALPK